ncbi:unnamed protein product [Protopolystoma xenopodis]|uniref:Uncharacterized protein n=1 Tax=Protopolystoma xenopodis TaxID=117903 RepID=A0A3S5B2B8_9PLAT|nr:unnamed protein product [Protopolystoma xenopodis]
MACEIHPLLRLLEPRTGTIATVTKWMDCRTRSRAFDHVRSFEKFLEFITDPALGPSHSNRPPPPEVTYVRLHCSFLVRRLHRHRPDMACLEASSAFVASAVNPEASLRRPRANDGRISVPSQPSGLHGPTFVQRWVLHEDDILFLFSTGGWQTNFRNHVKLSVYGHHGLLTYRAGQLRGRGRRAVNRRARNSRQTAVVMGNVCYVGKGTQGRGRQIPGTGATARPAGRAVQAGEYVTDYLPDVSVWLMAHTAYLDWLRPLVFPLI